MRIYYDSFFLSKCKNPRKLMKKDIKNGNTVIVDGSAMDIRCLQKHQKWLKRQLKKGTITIYMWFSLDQMAKKPYYWASIGFVTPGCDSIDEIVSKFLPQKRRFRKLISLINRYGKNSILTDKWYPTDILLPQELRLNPQTATRTDVLIKARQKYQLDIFDRFNKEYIIMIAKLAMADAYRDEKGKLKTL